MSEKESWTEIIKPQNKLFNLKLVELYNYRDLVFLFVKRDFVSVYKQTVLGPLWYLAQPLLTSVMLWFMFGKVADLGTDGQNKFLFYYSGVIAWQFFAQTILKVSNTFVSNASMFGKVYFPRLAVPFSLVFSNLIGFLIQFCFLLIFLGYFLFKGDPTITIDGYLIFVIIYLVLICLLGLGFGLIITSLTTKYRDFIYFITFGVQLLMYATPVIIPMSSIQAPFDAIVKLNPMTTIIVNFRGVFLRSEIFYQSIPDLIITLITALTVLLIGLLLFNKTEKNFMDTV